LHLRTSEFDPIPTFSGMVKQAGNMQPGRLTVLYAIGCGR
jgi:hypothetical protein